MSGRPWTEEEKATLRRMILDRMSYRDIAIELGRTYSACVSQATVLGLPMKEPSYAVTAVKRTLLGAA